MKIEVNLDRKFLIFALVIGVFTIGFTGVFAYTDPAVFGHSPNELDWVQPVTSNVYVLGNEGVGTSSPAAKVHINGTGYAGIFVENSGKRFSFYASDAGNLVVGDQVAGTARMVVNGSTGNIGIGTSAPGEKLEVTGNVKTNTVYSNSLNASNSMNTTKICLSGDCQTSWPSGGGRPASAIWYSWSGDGDKGDTAAHDFCFLVRVYAHDDDHDSRLQGCYIQPSTSGNFNVPQIWHMMVLGHGGSSYCSAICLNW